MKHRIKDLNELVMPEARFDKIMRQAVGIPSAAGKKSAPKDKPKKS